MYVPETGDMHMITAEEAESLRRATAQMAAEGTGRIAKLTRMAGDKPAVIFHEGEIVTLKGGAKFRISHIGKRKMVLRGLPADTES